jgi:hypothetical protein
METLPERFWNKVNKTETCWLWTASRTKKYGQYNHNRKPQLAHRVSYAAAYGPVPEGLVVDHKCHTELCVRPDHLRAVKQKVNVENRKGAQSNSKSGVRGVSWSKVMNKWTATVGHNYKVFVVGYFDTIEEAEKEVIKARHELHS